MSSTPIKAATLYKPGGTLILAWGKARAIALPESSTAVMTTWDIGAMYTWWPKQIEWYPSARLTNRVTCAERTKANLPSTPNKAVFSRSKTWTTLNQTHTNIFVAT
jgi:hypothetical protein